MSELVDDLEILVNFYSLFRCFPQEKSGLTKHINTVSRDNFDESIKLRIQDAIKTEIDRSVSLKNTREIEFENIQYKQKIDEALKITKRAEWSDFTNNIAKNYTEQKASRDAALIMCCFNFVGKNFFIILKYDLDNRMKMGESDLEEVKLILSRKCTKSLIYPSIISTINPTIHSNKAKVYQKSPAKYFVDFIGLLGDIINIEKKIEQELFERHSSNRMNLSTLMDELLKMIDYYENKYKIKLVRRIKLSLGSDFEITTSIENGQKINLEKSPNGDFILEINENSVIFSYINKEFEL